MGYGSQMNIKLNSKGGYVLYNGRNLVVVPDDTDIDSWDFVGDVDRMRNVKTSLLDIKYETIRLTQSDRDWMKKNDYKKGGRFYFSWYVAPKGSVFSGYTRSPLKSVFPTELKGHIDLDYMGTFEITVTVKPSNYTEFKAFFDDLTDYYPADEDCQEFIDDSPDDDYTIDEARKIMYDNHIDNMRDNYGA